MHRLLERQIKRYFGKSFSINSFDENLLDLLKDISQTYTNNDGERRFLENTITVNTEELNNLLRERSSLLESRTQENQEVINLLHQYKNAIDSSLIVSMTDINGIIKYANENFCKTSGYTKDELIGKSHNIIKNPDNPDSLFADIWNTIKNKKIWYGTFSNIKKSGEIFYINMTIVPLLDRNQEIREFMSLSEDVTPQIVYQKELKFQKERINTIFNAQENIVLIIDEYNGVVDANRRFFEVFNFIDLEDYRNRVSHISSLFNKNENYNGDNLSESLWFKQFLEKSNHLYKISRIDNNLDEQIFSIHCKKVILNNKTYYLCTFIDITELENARKKAEIAQKAKSTFLANMSHEIRTPLNAIIGFSDILCESDIKTDDKENAKIISRSAKSLLNIINDVLDISKMESGKLDISNESFLFEVFIEHIVELFSVISKEKKIKFIYNAESFLPYSLIADNTRLQQILTNLLSNAIKFTPENGEVIFTVKILDRVDDNVKIKFSVKDSGLGMTPEQQKIIFNPFSQADEGISRKFGGTGLGLAICSDIIKLMNSKIELVSNLNEGSEFSFTLDLKVDKFENTDKLLEKSLKFLLYCSEGNNEKLRANIQSHINKIGFVSDYNSQDNRIGDILFCCGMDNLNSVIKEFKKENSDSLIIYIGNSKNIVDLQIKDYINHYIDLPIYGSKIYNIIMDNSNLHKEVLKKSTNVEKFDGKILVAEDNPNNQKLIDILLEKLGLQVAIVANGEEAVEKYKQDKFDLILMDINMPIMDGLNATKEIRKIENEYYKIPIVALTANSIAGDKEKYLNQGMDDYLSKPIEFDKLVNILKKYLLSNEFHKIELQKITSNNISEKLLIPKEISEVLIKNFKNKILKDMEELNLLIINQDSVGLKQKAYDIKNSCLNMDLTMAIEILEKIEESSLNTEELISEFNNLNKIILFSCDL
ncbi:MAG: response regulator [Aliarcobacter sp.]|nr:response regulator [Aliarcobacter sp.]